MSFRSLIVYFPHPPLPYKVLSATPTVSQNALVAGKWNFRHLGLWGWLPFYTDISSSSFQYLEWNRGVDQIPKWLEDNLRVWLIMELGRLIISKVLQRQTHCVCSPNLRSAFMKFLMYFEIDRFYIVTQTFKLNTTLSTRCFETFVTVRIIITNEMWWVRQQMRKEEEGF